MHDISIHHSQINIYITELKRMASKITQISIPDGSITNQVLKQESAKKGTIYYLPCYIRLKVKTITDIALDQRTASFSGTLIFSFYYGGLPEDILDQFTTGIKQSDKQMELKDWKKKNDLKKAILLQFAHQETIQLRQEKDIAQQIDEDKKIVTFTVRKEFVCELEGEVYYTPFEIINLYLTVTIQTLPLYEKQNNGKSVSIKFNCMKNQNISVLGCSSKTQFGLYSIAVGLLDTKYQTDEQNKFKQISFCRCKEDNVQDHETQANGKKKEESEHHLKENSEEFNSVIKLKPHSSLQQQKPQIGYLSGRKTAAVPLTKMKPRRLQKLQQIEQQKQKKSKVKAFQYAHFRIPLFKNPAISVFSIFVPLWIIGFINLFIFFQERGLSGRIASVAVLTLAYIAFVPTINDQIPQTPTIKLVQILILMEIIASILCLIQSFVYKDETSDYNWKEDGFFIAAFILTALTFVIQMGFLVVHALYWKGKYTKEIVKKDGSKKQIGIGNRYSWENKECDKEFKAYLDDGDVQPLKQK